MPTEHSIIAIAAPVSVSAAIAEGDKKGPAKFESTFYTGGAMEIAGYDLPVVVDLAGLTYGNVLVANQYHDSTRPVGNFKVVNDGKSLVAQGTATAATEARDQVVNSAKDGYEWQASLEVKPREIEQLGKDKTAVVNGQTVTGPAYITRKGVLKGFGFVTHGADDNTTVAIAASAASIKEKKKMRAEVKSWIKATFKKITDEDITAMDADEVLAFENTFDVQAGVKPTEPPKPDPAPIKASGGNAVEKAMLEAKRCEELEDITASFLKNVPRETQTTDFLQKVADMKAQAVTDEWTPSKLDMEFLRCSIPISRQVSIHTAEKNVSNDVMEAAICMAGGLKNLDKHYSDQTLQAARDRFRNGIGLGELFSLCAAAQGHRSSNFRVDLDMQRAAMGMLPQHATGFSTLSLPGILSNSANKFLLEGWGAGENAWQAISDITSVRDFKTITQYRLGGTLKYEKVGPGGDIKHGVLGETSYTNKAETYGKMMAITRTDLINDDLNALTGVPRELGYGASEAFNEVFWTVFMANTWDYTASGVVSAAAVIATIQAAEAAFFALTKPNGEPVTINPNVILAPNGSYRTLANAMLSPVVTGGSSAVPVANSLANQYDVVRSAYLSNTAYSGYSTIEWYLIAVRPGFAPMQCAFLNGQQTPMIETASADFNTLGVQMRGVHDFGASIMEERAIVQGSGA